MLTKFGGWKSVFGQVFPFDLWCGLFPAQVRNDAKCILQFNYEGENGITKNQKMYMGAFTFDLLQLFQVVAG